MNSNGSNYKASSRSGSASDISTAVNILKIEFKDVEAVENKISYLTVHVDGFSLLVHRGNKVHSLKRSFYKFARSKRLKTV